MTSAGICKHPPCERPATKKSAGWCNAHYIRARNGKDMDNPPLRNRKRRGEVRLCSYAGCERESRRNGMCGLHAQRQSNGWNMDAPPRVMGQKKPCQQDGCDQNAASKGYCETHYRRLRNGGDMTAPIRHKVASYKGADCKEDGCDRPARAKGWCQMHWQRARKGVPLDDPLRITMRNEGQCQHPGCPREQEVKFLCKVHYNRRYQGLDMDAPVEMPKKYDVSRDRRGPEGGYVQVRVPGHFGKPVANSRNWYDEHRYVWECYWGEPLGEGENIHHKNGFKDDNRLENLELWTVSQPAGQRAIDLLEWADAIIAKYEPKIDKLLGTQLPLAMPPDDSGSAV